MTHPDTSRSMFDQLPTVKIVKLTIKINSHSIIGHIHMTLLLALHISEVSQLRAI